METAEVKLEYKSFNFRKYKFYIEAVGPFGIKRIAESKPFNSDKKIIGDNDLLHRSGFMSEGRKRQQQQVRDKHVNPLLQQLARDGWQISREVGDHWYSIRLQRSQA